MKIVIYGAGGVGGYFGARLAQAGNDVTFIARGKHLEAIQKNGLQLKSIKGNYLVKPAKATSNILDVKNVDLILICTKTWQLAEVAEIIKPVLNKNTMVISLLNGCENHVILSSIIDKKHVLGGLCKVVSFVEDYGVIKHVSYEPTIVFGELDNAKTSRAIAIEKLLTNAGITNKLATDIEQEIWTKYLYITTVSALGALTRATHGEMFDSPEIKAMLLKTAEEILAISKAKGVDLPSDIIEKQFAIIESLPYNTTASLQRDIMDGKPSELEAQTGTIVRFGKQLNIPTPINSFIYDCLLPQEKRARKI
ncbi:2-dehydropantoate 2-reductase [Lutibacter sp. HS1-25]|uniref:ketopantoate reductase family protein n=2 Tax=Lutibacter sp. HS1-25 TaxID=2485000 RepID=UPI0010107BF2|nr:2-dehydropantoate 2-reductase [Lutibacter sp. HS1-25]RXP45851.1 2-dehydropantoate 2-reductase [Lutibacter sp. HS1-25]